MLLFGFWMTFINRGGLKSKNGKGLFEKNKCSNRIQALQSVQEAKQADVGVLALEIGRGILGDGL